MMRCGLLGEKLGHSYSPAIHAQLADYAYGLYEVAPEDLPAFLTGGDFDALNVTIPYKKAVIPYCAELSPIAQKLGSVNVLVRRADGTLYGDNADAFGFEYLVRHSGIDVAGQKALVLGNGGASATIQAVLEQLGARVTVISRHGPDNYDNLDRHADARVIVNTTPVGMYPNTGRAAVDLRQFPQCAGVLDIVYNPARTALLLQAESLGIPCAGGLYMLVAQAKRSCEVFTDTVIDDAEILRIHRLLRQEMENIVLIGMPGSGKSTIAALLAERLHRPVLDSDAQVGGHVHPGHFCRRWRGRLPCAGDGRTRRARQALGRGACDRRRQHLPRGKLPAPAPERHDLLAPARPRAAAEGRPPHLPAQRPCRALRAACAAVRPLRRRGH